MLLGGMELEVIEEGLRRVAIASAANPIAYISALLADWKSQRLRTLVDVDGS